jgi:hypothetical protein
LSRTRSPAPGQSKDDAIDVDEVTWPGDFYVVDVVKGFDLCDQARRSRGPIAETFTAVFGVPFRSTTYYKNRKQWGDASQTVRDKSLAAGRTLRGTWGVFMSRTKPQKARRTTIHHGKNAHREVTPEQSVSP